MTKKRMTGIMVNGSLTTAGVTFYTRNGRTVVRTSHSNQPERRTRAQFDVRMRVKHTSRLWMALADCDPQFHGSRTTFTGFASLANRLPVVYLPNKSNLEFAQLLLPNMPISEGTLPTIEMKIGTVNGRAALITSLQRGAIKRGEVLRLYTLCQTVENGVPTLDISYRNVPMSEFRDTAEGLALVGEDYADPMCGWALVHIAGDNCSTQTVVTNCTYYERFTTEEALQTAAKSYGGLTE